MRWGLQVSLTTYEEELWWHNWIGAFYLQKYFIYFIVYTEVKFQSIWSDLFLHTQKRNWDKHNFEELQIVEVFSFKWLLTFVNFFRKGTNLNIIIILLKPKNIAWTIDAERGHVIFLTLCTQYTTTFQRCIIPYSISPQWNRNIQTKISVHSICWKNPTPKKLKFI